MPAVSSPSGRSGADRCPGALRAHQAADGLLVRVRLPGGRLSTSQLRRLAATARRDADGTLELTSRANVQLRGIPDQVAVDRIAAVLVESGLLPSATHETVRNIVASPLSGLEHDGRPDVRPVVARVDEALCACPDLADLSGRFLIAVDDGRGDVAALGADLCWLADPGALLVAGRDVGLRADADEAAETIVAAARAFLRHRAGRRDVWRVADLPEAPAAIVAALGGSHAAPVDVPRYGPPPVGPDPAGFVVAAAPLGRLTAAQAEAVAALTDGPVVVTPWRTVVVVAAPESAVPVLTGAGLVVDPASPWVGVTACAGRPGCGSALADVRADATAALTAATPPADDALPLHWAGCDRCCGRPSGPAALAVATGAGYRVAGPRGDHHGPLSERVAQARRPR
ncbi:precorrin-3B synthase [Verrucosispora sp. NA02020]|uniref:precorrin-3B synthase n=1 Tax=Verrucosispora sp. NA02020 TaxID=2742132 RepID=UPI001591E358|nr:precorrin-3B synthase [Verrucosispora sp. NA02020]QKW13981.1 precorrin-3B synthase [Verrucosispora sp. NA02020]